MIPKNEKFCIAPWLVLSTTTYGHVKPCCNADLDGRYSDPDGNFYNLANSPIDEVWNSEDTRNLRKAFLKGEQPERCRMC